MFVMCRSGDMCDDDKDGDNIPNDEDNCELTKNTDQGDIDEDGIGDECDNCPEIANKDQTDDNQNFIGDICELGIFHKGRRIHTKRFFFLSIYSIYVSNVLRSTEPAISRYRIKTKVLFH